MGFIPEPLTIYNNINKLCAGTNIIFDLQNKTLKTNKYYTIPKYNPINKKELLTKAKELLSDSTRIRMIADVPIGAFLSGGLDSTSIVSAMSKHTNIKLFMNTNNSPKKTSKKYYLFIVICLMNLSAIQAYSQHTLFVN